MADKLLSDADVFGTPAPSAPAQGPKPMSDAEVFGGTPAATPQVPRPDYDASDPVNQAIFERSNAGKVLNAAQGNWFTRPFKAAGIAISDALHDSGDLGLSYDTVKKLEGEQLQGYKGVVSSLRRSVTEGVLMPAADAADTLMRVTNAGFTGATTFAGGILNEVEGGIGMGRSSVETVAEEGKRDAEALAMTPVMAEFGSLRINAGMTESGQVTRAVQPTMKEIAAIPEKVEKVEGVAPAAERATVPPAVTQPVKSPMIDEVSGNLNLKYIGANEDVKTLLSKTAQAYADENGVTITHAETVEEAQKYLDKAMAETADGVPESLANYMRGDPVNRPLAYAARQLTAQSARDAWEKVKAMTATGSAADVNAAYEADDRLMALTGVRHEVTAESGRTLNSFQIPLGDEEAANFELLAEKMSGMSKDERLRLLSTFDSPEEVAKFVRDVKKPTWSEMGIFYIINNYLSGPVTHAAYAASWGVQTVIRAGIETPIAATVGRLQKYLGKTLEPEEIKALQAERDTLAQRLAEADSTQGRKLPAAEALKIENRVKDINTQLSNSTTVMPGEAAARFYGIGQGAWDSISAAGRALRTGNIQMLPGEMAAAKNAAKEAVDAALKEGKSATEAQKAGEAAYNKATIYSNNPILERATLIKNPAAKALAQAAGFTIGIPTRVIAGIHSLQKFSGYSESMNALAYRQAVAEGAKTSEEIGARIAQIKSEMNPAMVKQAADEAKYAALMGKPGKLGQNIENLAHTNNWTRMIVPFSRVVTNLANQKYLERTPLGLFSADIRAALTGEKGNAAQAQQIAKMLTGSTLLAAGAWLKAQGINNGQASDNPNERARAYMEGKPPYTVRIGDWNVPHRFFGVPGGSLSLGADVHDVWQNYKVNDEDAWSIMGNSFHVLGNDMLQENALKGAADLYDAIRNRDQNAAKAYVLNALSSAATPYSVGMSQTTRMLDPLMRSTMGDNFWDRFEKTEMAHIPFESSSLLPQVDIFGRPMQRGGDYEAMLKDPVMQQLVRLNMFPAKASTRILNVKLNDQQYFDYATKSGALFYHNVEALVQDPSWPTFDEDTQREMIHKAQKDARADARQYMCIAYPGISKSCAKYNTDLVEGVNQQ